ncbi:MAG: GDP-mannose 4,6-dehydratase [Acidobacteria bacterium]|nr:GDP-mannose 4,6-dehydratase [Acidobacteriota bacterium]
MRVLITGVSGFVGHYLVEHIVEASPEADIWGLLWAGEFANAPRSVFAIEGDLTNIYSLKNAVDQAKPEVVFHLAAASSVASSWDNPGLFLEVNALGTVNLLEAVRDYDARIVVSSSAEIYGAVPMAEQPIVESAPLAPISPYGVSKASQDLVTAQYFHGHGLDTVRIRPFHHTGPRRPARFVASSFARQIARIERGLDPPCLAVGNLEAIRDITDVRDVVRAYWLGAMHGKGGEAYNVCSGRQTTMQQVLDGLLTLTDIEVEIEVDPARMRVADIPCQVGDNSRFSDLTGWRAEIPLEQTLGDLLDWWRDRVRDH